ncbi:MAG: CoA transferase [Marmoricola sp.]
MADGPYPLSGYTVVDFSSGIAGGYCTKLLADAGATVVKLEAPEGDPLRSWSASQSPAPSGGEQPLFAYLSGAKHSVVLDPDDAEAAVRAARLVLARADAVVWSPESRLASLPELAPARIAADFPHLAITAITPFGLTGPWAGRPATEFTLQAWSGGIVGIGRGAADRAPIHIGGQVGEWLSGAYAAVSLLASRRHRRAGVTDLSKLEVSALTTTYYPVTFFDCFGQPQKKERSLVPPGVSAAKDGLIGVATGTQQQRSDLYVMLGHPEWLEDDALISRPAELIPEINAWLAERTVAEIQELTSVFRIPNAPVGNGELIPQWEQVKLRDSLATSADGRFLQPRSPYRISSADLRLPSAAPALGEHTVEWTELPAARTGQSEVEGGLGLPLAGLRVLDMTAFWAGPMATHTLALMGAEVIHLESTKRPDGGRLVLGLPPSIPSWWERSPIHLGGNASKKDVTIDFTTPEGRDLLLSLIETCDVLVENFTPRVLNQVGLDFDALQKIRPDLVMVRMPGFGLEGPWRDNAAFAFVIEDAAGLTWLTGYPDAHPVEPYCIGDPNAGIHAVVGLLLALEQRDRTGQGALVEAAMIDAALSITAEQIIEQSANGVLLQRAGNRGPVAAPQNLYRADGTDEFGNDDLWVALAVCDDEQWDAVVNIIGDDTGLADERFATAAGRREHHDAIDELLAPWFVARKPEEAVDALWSAGVPVAKVMLPHRQPDIEQFSARGFHEQVEHPVCGSYRQSTLPFRWPGAPTTLTTRHAPLLGEHNEEVLAGIGIAADEFARLEEAGVIGTKPRGQD